MDTRWVTEYGDRAPMCAAKIIDAKSAIPEQLG